MNEQEQVWSVRRAAAVLSESVNRTERFADVKSAVLDFPTVIDTESNVLGDDDFAVLLDAALICREKTAETCAF